MTTTAESQIETYAQAQRNLMDLCLESKGVEDLSRYLTDEAAMMDAVASRDDDVNLYH